PPLYPRSLHDALPIFAILLYSSVSKAFHLPANWTLESAQFTMAAYYMLGGAFAMQTGDHVRMDLFYGTWSVRKRAIFDTVTAVADRKSTRLNSSHVKI